MHSGGIAAHTACIKMEKEARDHGRDEPMQGTAKDGNTGDSAGRAEQGKQGTPPEDTLIEACTYRIQTLLTYRTYLLRTARRQAEQPEPIAL